MAGVPDVQTFRRWLEVPVSPSLPDTDLQRVIDAEVAGQVLTCRVPMTDPPVDSGQIPAPDLEAWPADLVQALLRRVGRELAARGLPTGLVGDGEYGPARLPFFDSEIERLEGPRRKVVFG